MFAGHSLRHHVLLSNDWVVCIITFSTPSPICYMYAYVYVFKKRTTIVTIVITYSSSISPANMYIVCTENSNIRTKNNRQIIHNISSFILISHSKNIIRIDGLHVQYTANMQMMLLLFMLNICNLKLYSYHHLIYIHIHVRYTGKKTKIF